MFDRLLLKTIANRLVESGECSYDPRCIHAGHGSCMADRETLKEKEADMRTKIKGEEPCPNIVYLTLDPDKHWPCAEAKAYIILLPPGLEGDDQDD